MKKLIIAIITLSLFSSCNSENKTKKEESNIDSIPKKKENLSAFNIIYNNNYCLDWEVETFPIIDLKYDTISLNKNIEGYVFFSSDYLRKLADCNNLDYKISFDIFKRDGKYDTSIVENDSDTILFKIPYDSLKKINSTKTTNVYLLKGTLKASFFKLDKVLGYDTMMTINKRIFVLKDGQKK